MTSVYIHVPFCVRKCAYCAFESAEPRAGDERLYLEALASELTALGERPMVKTLYIGGGTPTALSPPAWRELIGIIDGAFSFAPGAEVTVEGNPVSLSREHLTLWRGWRVTRVSVGVQSFDDDELRLLGRPHDARAAADAASACHAAGFAVSLDLMFGLPGSTLKSWGRTLRDALSLAPDHISVYQLTIEPGTPFERMAASLPPLPDGYEQYRLAQWLLPRAGLAQYEVANFARPGRESRHNLNYWRGGDYIGAGPGAWGFGGGVRYKNAWPLGAYAARASGPRGAARVFEESLPPEEAAREAAMLALRTSDGIDWRTFAARHGEGAAREIRAELDAFPAELVSHDGEKTSLTPKGMRLANIIWSEII